MIVPLTQPASEFQLTWSPTLNIWVIARKRCQGQLLDDGGRSNDP